MHLFGEGSLDATVMETVQIDLDLYHITYLVVDALIAVADGQRLFQLQLGRLTLQWE